MNSEELGLYLGAGAGADGFVDGHFLIPFAARGGRTARRELLCNLWYLQ